MNLQTPSGSLIQFSPQDSVQGSAVTLPGNADAVLSGTAPQLIIINPAANRNVNLGPVSDNVGRSVLVRSHTGAFTVQVRTSAAVNIGTALAADRSGLYYCDGVTWTKAITGLNV